MTTTLPPLDGFATRDLVPANDRWPSYRVLVVSSTRVRILEGRFGALVDVDSPKPPRCVPSPSKSHDGRRPRGRPERWADKARRARLTIDAADAALERHQHRRHLPLVLIGPPRATAVVIDRSAHAGDVVATVTGNLIGAPAHRLARLAAPHITAWARRLHLRAVARLEDAELAGRLRWGLNEAWQEAIHGHVEQLWVSENYAPPAPLVGQGRAIELVTPANTSAPGAIDDVVGELIEIVTFMGGTVHQVHPAVLGDRAEPVAVAVAVQRRRHHHSHIGR